MTRQKILLIIGGAVVALIIGKSVLGLYSDALSSRQAQIDAFKRKLADVKFQKAKSEMDLREWRSIGKQTLSMDPNETMRRLRDELYDMSKKSGLTKPNVDLGTVQNTGKNGVKVFTSQFTAEGSLDKIVEFLFNAYRRPYVLRLRTLNIAPASTGRNAVKGQMKLTTKLETLILPPNGKAPSITPVDLKEDEPIVRTLFAKFDDYRVILDRQMTEPYTPPMPGKATAPTPVQDARDIEATTVTLTWKAGVNTQKHSVFFGEGTPNLPLGTIMETRIERTGLKPGVQYVWRVDEIGEGGTTTGELWRFTTKAPPPTTAPTIVQRQDPPKLPEQPPLDSEKVLIRVLSSPVAQQAVLVDNGQQTNVTAPETRVQIGDPFYGGILVYVHRRGVISERDGAMRFHAIGQQLKGAAPLTEQDFPEIWYEVKKLQAQAPGISDRPG
jgi:hypothetical protein